MFQVWAICCCAMTATPFTDGVEKARNLWQLIGFGLGVMVSDVNNDSWPDIYVSNDFTNGINFYINNHDGTFHGRYQN